MLFLIDAAGTGASTLTLSNASGLFFPDAGPITLTLRPTTTCGYYYTYFNNHSYHCYSVVIIFIVTIVWFCVCLVVVVFAAMFVTYHLVDHHAGPITSTLLLTHTT